MTKDKRPQRSVHGTIVTSGGTRFESSPVGDRLEFTTVRPSDRPMVNREAYKGLTNRPGSGERQPASQLAAKTDQRGRRALRRWQSPKKTGFDDVPPGIRVKDVARKILPKLSIRLTISGLAAVIVGILVYNIYTAFYIRYKTEIVTVSPYVETIDVEGVAIRDEIMIEGTLNKTSVKAVRNGDKVSKGEPIVNIYNSSQEAAAYERIAVIEQEAKELSSMVTASEDSANAADNISRLLDNKMVALNDCSVQRVTSDIGSLKREISYLLNKRMVIMRQTDDYNARIKQLESEKEELLKKYSQEPKTINAEHSGYFTDSCDGYEELLKTSMVGGLTVEKLDRIMNGEVSPPKKVIGKLVSSFTWYLACPVSVPESEDLLVGSLYTLYLPYSESESIEAVLERLNKAEGQDKYLAVFRCSSLASELCTARVQPVKIQKRRCEGFAIKKSALHAGVREEVVKNPRSGDDFPRAHLVYLKQVTYPSVYAVVAGQINEKEVSIIYSTDKMVICSPAHDGGSFLALKDTVVTEERGLYNGKLVR